MSVPSLGGGLSYMWAGQLITRMATFGLNAAVLRHAAPALVGAAAQLQVVCTLVLFLAREALRRTATRAPRAPAALAWLALPLGVVSAALVAAAWLWGASAEERAVPHYQVAVLLTAAAALVELCGEAAYIRGLRALAFQRRFVVETLAVVALCTSLYVCVVHMHMGLLGWAVAQLTYGVVSAVGHHALAPAGTALETVAWEPGLGRLWAAFQWQAVQTLALQEGERVLLKVTSSLADQGMYAVVVNLASLVVRIVFLPLEDVAFAFFARQLRSRDGREEAHTVLCVLLRLLCTLAACVVAVGPPLSFVALDMLYGPRLSRTTAPAILRVYCGYIALLALNGVTEAFVRAAITPAQQTRLNAWLLFTATVQAAASVVLLRQWAAVGLVVANCIGVALRLAYSLRFVTTFFYPHFSLRSIVPPLPVLAYLAAARVLLDAPWFGCDEAALARVGRLLPAVPCLLHAALGAALLAGALGLVWAVDGGVWLLQVRDVWRMRAEHQKSC